MSGTFEMTFRVGPKHHCEMSFDPTTNRINAQWAPKMPTHMSRRMWRDYRRGRFVVSAMIEGRSTEGSVSHA